MAPTARKSAPAGKPPVAPTARTSVLAGKPPVALGARPARTEALATLK